MTNPNKSNEQASDKCNRQVFERGAVLGIYAMPKQEAEALAKRLTAETGNLHDWHYSGGRVVMKFIEGLGDE